MTPSKLDEDLSRFITEHISSVEELEILLLLRDRLLPIPEISRELRANPESVDNRIRRLTDRGLLVRQDADPPHFTLAKDPSLHGTAQRLAQAYREKRFIVIDLIFSKPNNILRVFADAFKIKKEPSDG